MKFIISILGILAGIMLISMAFFWMASDDDYNIRDKDVTKYVGGDAYNYIIESNLRAAYIGASELSFAIFFTGGVINITISLLGLVDSLKGKTNRRNNEYFDD